jgi:hypothetical protein
LRGGDDTHIFPVGPDEADFRRANPIVDPGAGFALRRSVVRAACYGCCPYTMGLAAKITLRRGVFNR